MRKEKLRILMVDDDPNVTYLLSNLPALAVYEFMVVNDSSIAVEKAESELPDLIMTDLMMPQPDGFRITRMLRGIPTFNNTPILIVTALDDSDSRAVAFGAGANDYLTKPFHPGELNNKIEDLLMGKDLGLFE